MYPPSSANAASTSRRSPNHTASSIFAALLLTAFGACSLFRPKPVAPIPPTQQQLASYAQEQTALRNEVSLPKEETPEHCNQLVGATPGVEELRSDRGLIESRQWTLVANGSAPNWAFVKPGGGPSDGWAPKPGIDKLNFNPPLEPSLSGRPSIFLAYAPVVSNTLEDSQNAATVREVFGSAQGEFTWRGKNYSYTLTTDLPCFPRMQ